MSNATLENYLRDQCEALEDQLRKARARITELEQENAALKSDLDRTVKECERNCPRWQP